MAKEKKRLEKGDRYSCPCGCGCVIEVVESAASPQTCGGDLPECCVAEPQPPVCSCGCEMDLCC